MKDIQLEIRKVNFVQDQVEVFAPATVANLNCGFDVLGLCLENPGDTVRIRKSAFPGIKISSIEGDQGKLPFDIYKNTVSISIIKMLEYVEGFDGGFEIELIKGMPIGSGLGSSAASTVAGVYAANEMLGKPFSKHELLHFCVYGEEIACGTGHADNVAPSLFGGMVLIKGYSPLQIIQLPVPANLYVSIVYPHVEIHTQDARRQLSENISMKDGVNYWGNLAGFISSLYTGDMELFKHSLIDNLVEPIRAKNIPHFEELKSAALSKNVLGFGISGSGPSLFTFSNSIEQIDELNHIYQEILLKYGCEATFYASKVNLDGPKII